MARIERNAREIMSDWRFWMGVAYAGIILTVVALVFLFSKIAHEEASRTATARAGAATQVGQCFTSVKNAPVTEGFIDAHEAIIVNGLIANRASLNASPLNDPLHQIRLKSILRLEKAQRNVTQLRKLIRAATPTRKKCIDLAHTLGVDPSRYTATRRNP
jgi:hypothetical protein